MTTNETKPTSIKEDWAACVVAYREMVEEYKYLAWCLERKIAIWEEREEEHLEVEYDLNHTNPMWPNMKGGFDILGETADAMVLVAFGQTQSATQKVNALITAHTERYDAMVAESKARKPRKPRKEKQ